MTEETQLAKLKERLFGENGLGVTNIKIAPGHNRHATPEEIAGELNKALDRLKQGDFEIIAEVGQ